MHDESSPGLDGALDGTPADSLISQKVCITSLCKCQFPHEFVNVFFTLAIIKDKLTDLCGN